jgi:cytoskeletal protein CcmA (bactofilin family)
MILMNSLDLHQWFWFVPTMFSDVFKKAEEPRDEPVSKASEQPSKQAKESNTMSSTAGAVLSEDVEFKGTMVFNTALDLNGKFEGEIIAEGPLTIGENAVIKGNIVAKSTVLLKGKMQGNIEAADRVEVSGTAQLFGDVKASKFSLKEGAVFVGTSDTADGKKGGDFQNIFSKLGKSASTASSTPAADPLTRHSDDSSSAK